MLAPFGNPSPGATAPRPTLRLLVALLVALQLTGPAVAAFADPAPTPPSHTDHIGRTGDPGCTTFHDDVFCASCRVLSAEPTPSAAPGLPPLQPHRASARVDRCQTLPSSAVVASPRARAPPRI